MEDIYSYLNNITAGIFKSIEKEKSSRRHDQISDFHTKTTHEIEYLLKTMCKYKSGESVENYKRKLKILLSDFEILGRGLTGKFKVYLRGCGNAGKSTLMNALLSLDEEHGAKMSKLPMTFKIDIFSDELDPEKAQVRLINQSGNVEVVNTSKTEAQLLDEEERRLFDESKKRCDEIIKKKTQNIYLEKDIHQLESDIYKEGLYKTKIREIKWGIGNNSFFHNCVLIDTPGLAQELRFTNVLEDVKNYEVDCIIWVVRATKEKAKESLQQYNEENEIMKDIYNGKRVLFVINVDDKGVTYLKRKKLEKIAHDVYNATDTLCINALQAYNGNINNSTKDIEESNIKELRKKINEFFIAKTSDDYWNEQTVKMNRFIHGFYKEVKNIEIDLAERICFYEGRKTEIYNKKDSFIKEVKNVLTNIKSSHLRQIKARINNQYKSQITQLALHNRLTPSFIIDEIICVDEIQGIIKAGLQKVNNEIASEFKKLNRTCIISNYETQFYKEKHFNEQCIDNDIIKHPFISDNIKLEGEWLLKIGEFFDDIFGGSVIAEIIQGILNLLIEILFGSIHTILNQEISKELEKWYNTINLNDIIDSYTNYCIDTLNSSMELSCGNYDDMKALKHDITNFIDNQERLETRTIKLREIMGGTA